MAYQQITGIPTPSQKTKFSEWGAMLLEKEFLSVVNLLQSLAVDSVEGATLMRTGITNMLLATA